LKTWLTMARYVTTSEHMARRGARTRGGDLAWGDGEGITNNLSAKIKAKGIKKRLGRRVRRSVGKIVVQGKKKGILSKVGFAARLAGREWVW